MTTEPGFQLPSEDIGLARLESSPAGASDAAVKLLQENHEKWHMYFNVLSVGAHNHIAHSVLTTLALGGTAEEVKRAYDDGVNLQRPMSQPGDDDEDDGAAAATIDELRDPARFRARIQDRNEYPNFLAFFKREIARRGGDWRAVVSEYCLARTPLADLMLAQLFEGGYHPLIHVGFGVEFGLANIVAEGLAQTASHDSLRVGEFLFRAEAVAAAAAAAAAAAVPAPGGHNTKLLADLWREVYTTPALRHAARLSDGQWKVRDGVLGRAMEPMVQLAAQYVVPRTEEGVARATAEMISCAAWASAAAAHRRHPARAPRIDFLLMHCVTSSLFLTVLGRDGKGWIPIEDRARLVEWKARADLVIYAAAGAPELRGDVWEEYEPTLSRGMDWRALYQAVNRLHDDGHVAKFVRALRNGEMAAAPYGEAATFLPVRGDAWLRVAQLCYDTTADKSDDRLKWVMGAGFDELWDLAPGKGRAPRHE